MEIEFLRNKQREKVANLIQGFSIRYVTDLKNFATTTEHYGLISPQTAKQLCRLIGKWHGCRPSPVSKNLLPLLTDLDADLKAIATIDLRSILRASSNEMEAISQIWSSLMNQICDNKPQSEVAASKAMLILTNGRLGPALDSNARKSLRLPRIQSSGDYLAFLLAISEDVAAFEKANSPILLEDLVPKEWCPVLVGRAYDMAIGPR